MPTSDEQIQFLVSLQRLLDEGQFVASYKFALLLSLADLCVELGNDTGSALTLTTDAIGDKFIQYYWRQAIPYPAASKASVLKQNTGKHAAVVNLIGTARGKHGDSIASIMNWLTRPSMGHHAHSLSHRKPPESVAKVSPKAVRLARLGRWKAAFGISMRTPIRLAG
jgi:hypothetical protein